MTSCSPTRPSASTRLPEGSDRVRLNWEIAEGYYLYRARIKVSDQQHRTRSSGPRRCPTAR